MADDKTLNQKVEWFRNKYPDAGKTDPEVDRALTWKYLKERGKQRGIEYPDIDFGTAQQRADAKWETRGQKLGEVVRATADIPFAATETGLTVAGEVIKGVEAVNVKQAREAFEAHQRKDPRTLEEIAAGVEWDGDDESRRLAEDFFRAFDREASAPGVIDEVIGSSSIVQAGRDMNEWFDRRLELSREALAFAPERDILGDFAAGIASTVPAIAATAIGGPGAGLATMSGMMGGQNYREAQAAGKDGATLVGAYLGGAAIGATEVIPIARAFGRLSKMGGKEGRDKLIGMLGVAAAGAGEEGVQEFGQTVLEGILSQHILEYADKQSFTALMSDALYSGFIGSMVGGVLGGGGAAGAQGYQSAVSRRRRQLANQYAEGSSPDAIGTILREADRVYREQGATRAYKDLVAEAYTRMDPAGAEARGAHLQALAQVGVEANSPEIAAQVKAEMDVAGPVILERGRELQKAQAESDLDSALKASVEPEPDSDLTGDVQAANVAAIEGALRNLAASEGVELDPTSPRAVRNAMLKAKLEQQLKAAKAVTFRPLESQPDGADGEFRAVDDAILQTVTTLGESGVDVPEIVVMESAVPLPIQGAYHGGRLLVQVVNGVPDAAKLSRSILFHELLHARARVGSQAFRDLVTVMREQAPEFAKAAADAYVARVRKATGKDPLPKLKATSPDAWNAAIIEEGLALAAEQMPTVIETLLTSPDRLAAAIQREPGLLGWLKDLFYRIYARIAGESIETVRVEKKTGERMDVVRLNELQDALTELEAFEGAALTPADALAAAEAIIKAYKVIGKFEVKQQLLLENAQMKRARAKREDAQARLDEGGDPGPTTVWDKKAGEWVERRSPGRYDPEAIPAGTGQTRGQAEEVSLTEEVEPASEPQEGASKRGQIRKGLPVQPVEEQTPKQRRREARRRKRLRERIAKLPEGSRERLALERELGAIDPYRGQRRAEETEAQAMQREAREEAGRKVRRPAEQPVAEAAPAPGVTAASGEEVAAEVSAAATEAEQPVAEAPEPQQVEAPAGVEALEAEEREVYDYLVSEGMAPEEALAELRDMVEEDASFDKSEFGERDKQRRKDGVEPDRFSVASGGMFDPRAAERNQTYTSERTSLKQIPASFKVVDWKPGTVNFDIGGGAFDLGTEYLSERGVTNLIYDPFNRSRLFNMKNVARAKGGVDTVTVANVLNVIAERGMRNRVLREAAAFLKPGGEVYIQVYEGDGKGESRVTAKGWQEHRKLDTYISEVEEVFGEVERKGKVLIAKSPLEGQDADEAALLMQAEQAVGMKRHPEYGVGKLIGGDLYVEKSHMDRLPQKVQRIARRLAEQMPDYDYKVVKWNEREGTVSFIQSPDFDTAQEPLVTASVKHTPGKGFGKQTKHSNVYHHKWLFVAPDYAGFDVGESYQRTLDVVDMIERGDKKPSQLGTKRAWDEFTASAPDRFSVGAEGLADAKRIALEAERAPSDGPKIRVMFHSSSQVSAEELHDGLYPELGDWVREVYAGATDDPDFDVDEQFIGGLFLSDAPTWVGVQVARKLGKDLADVTEADIREHGTLAVISNLDPDGDPAYEVYRATDGGYQKVEDAMGREMDLWQTPLYEEGLWGGAREVAGMEDGDIVTVDSVEPDAVLSGQHLLDFMEWWRDRYGADGSPNPDDRASRFSVAQTSTPEFRRWFGDSKVVDAEGRPLVVYHGTNADTGGAFAFRDDLIGSANDAGFYGRGFYFATFAGEAAFYGRNVLDVYLSIQNPLELTNSTGDLTSLGHFLDWYPKMKSIGATTQGLDATADAVEMLMRLVDEKAEVYPLRAKDELGWSAQVTHPDFREDGDGYEYTQNAGSNWGRPFESKEDALDSLRHELVRTYEREVEGFEIPASLSDYIRVWLPGGAQEVRDRAEAAGHDGIHYGDEWIAFRPDQIKSATGNVGAFGQRPVTEAEAAPLGMTAAEANEAQARGDVRYSVADVAAGREAEPGAVVDVKLPLSVDADTPGVRFSVAGPRVGRIPKVKFADILKEEPFVYTSDRTRVGTYKGLDPDSGISIPLQGGPSYPFIRGNKRRAGWAFLGPQMQKDFQTSVNEGSGVGVIMLYAPGNARANLTFHAAYMAEVRHNIKTGVLTEEVFLEVANDLRVKGLARTKKNKTTGKVGPWIGKDARYRPLWEKTWESLEDYDLAMREATFDARSNLVYGWAPKKKTNRGAVIGADYLVGAGRKKGRGLPNIDQMIRLIEDPAYDGLERGHLVGAVRFRKGDAAMGSAEDIGVEEHMSYPLVTAGDGIGHFEEAVHILDIATTKRTPTNAIRAAELSRPTLSEGMRLSVAATDGDLDPRADGAIQYGELTRLELVRRRMQDYFYPVRKVQRAIGEVPESMDVDLAETTFSGRAGARLLEFEDAATKELNEILGDDLTLDDAHDFAYAAHAPERNKWIAKKFPDQGWGTEVKPGSGMRTSEAKRTVKEKLEGEHGDRYRRLNRFLRRMAKQQIRTLDEAGLLTQDFKDAVAAQGYKYYVPLIHTMKGRPTIVQGRGFNVRGSGIKKAGGRVSAPDNVVLNLLAKNQEAIVRSEKAKVDRALYNLVTAHPDPTLWTVMDVPTSIEDDGAGVLKQLWDARIDKVEQTVFATVDGEVKAIVFAERGADLARALNKTGVDGAHSLLRKSRKVLRYLAAINTSWNPEFVLTNFLRDAQTAGIVVAGEGKGGMMAVLKGAAPAIRDIYRHERGKQESSWWQRMEDAGGRTGWYHAKSLDEIQEDFAKTIKRLQREGPQRALNAGHAIAQFIDDANSAVENGVRLSAFKWAVQNGASDARAAEFAKNLTVNFNRQGEAQWLSSMYMFANASIQGSMRVATTLVKSKYGKRIAGGLVLGGFLADLLNYAMSPDDEDGENSWDAQPEWAKDRYFMLPMGNGSFVSIPMPYGFNFFQTLGRKMGEIARHAAGEGGSKPTQAGADLLSSALGAFSPVGDFHSADWQSGLRFVSPTILDPMVELATNRNWRSQPIRPEGSPFDRVDPPAHTVAWDSTNPIWKNAAGALNWMTGGDEFEEGLVSVSPEDIQYLVEFGLGGVLRVGNRTLNTFHEIPDGPVKALLDGPFLRQLHRTESERKGWQVFRESAVEIEWAKNKYDVLRERGDREGAEEVRKELGHMLDLHRDLQRIDRRRRRMRTKIEAAEGAEKDELTDALYSEIRAFNRKVSEARQ